jgi:hypothetical protein
LWNVTLLGTSTTTAFHMKEGTLGTLRNFIVANFGTVLSTTYATVNPADIWLMAGELVYSDGFFFNNTALGPDNAADADDMGFDEQMSLADAIADAANNLADDVDPEIDLGFTVGGTDAPNYVPGAAAADLAAATPRPRSRPCSGTCRTA